MSPESAGTSLLASGRGVSQVVLVVKNLPDNADDAGDVGLIPGLERLPWMRAWQPTAVFLPGRTPGNSLKVHLVENLPANAGDTGFQIPGLERSRIQQNS